MSMDRPRVVFFDIGGTLGDARLSGPPYRLERLEVFPYVPGMLKTLRAARARLGLISNIGAVIPENERAVEDALRAAGILDFFEATLRVYGPKDDVVIFRRALALAGIADSPQFGLFVGEDARERYWAGAAGMRAVPHPLLVSAALEGQPLTYARITAPAPMAGRHWQQALLDAGVVPCHVAGEEGTVVYAIAARPALARVMNMRFVVQLLGADDDPMTTDLYLLRDDLASQTGALDSEGQAARLVASERMTRWLIGSSLEGLHVAVPGSASIEDLHFPVARHGHNVKLAPDVSLLRPLRSVAATAFASEPTDRDLTETEIAAMARLTTEKVGACVERYAGVTPLDDAGAVRTRHSLSPDNARVTEALQRDLARAGGGTFRVRMHPFPFQGRQLYNVEADWPGTSSELVLMTAHLDSTAAQSHVGPGSVAYRPDSDPAPGADDDASGVAAVVSAAEVLRTLAGARPPARTIRFVLFNAEEQGLIGSRAYARALAASGARVAGVFQMDMIGNDFTPPPLFEVHAGYSPSSAIERQSLALARRIARLRPRVSPGLSDPELCLTKGPGSEERDGAEGRSDHTSFHERGYAACCASEDLFANEAPLPPAEVNDHYHKATDVQVNGRFAADIARVVAAAVWLTANP
jgi:bacterial leucyl aminopeptidase